MTREGAIDVLKHNYPSACFTDLCEAVEIAIQALSAQPNTDNIYAELSKAYNIPGLPDEAIDIIGGLMLSLDEPSAQPDVPDTNVGDMIYRQAAIDVICDDKIDSKSLEIMTVLGDGYAALTLNTTCDRHILAIKNLPSAQPERKWIPVKTRPMTEEERREYSEYFGCDIEYEDAVMFECKMPDDGQDVWVCSKCGIVWQDTCVVEEGICLEENGDWLDIVAWMPFEKPEPWKGESDA